MKTYNIVGLSMLAGVGIGAAAVPTLYVASESRRHLSAPYG